MSGNPRSAKKRKRAIADVAAEIVDTCTPSGYWLHMGDPDIWGEIWDTCKVEGLVKANLDDARGPAYKWLRIREAIEKTARGEELFNKRSRKLPTCWGLLSVFERTETKPTPREDGKVWVSKDIYCYPAQLEEASNAS